MLLIRVTTTEQRLDSFGLHGPQRRLGVPAVRWYAGRQVKGGDASIADRRPVQLHVTAHSWVYVA